MLTDSEKKWRRVAIYARVSKKDHQTTEQQIDTLVRWVAPQTDTYEAIAEEESSRKRRPRLEALRARLMNAEFDAFVVWKLDRIARSTEELLRWRRERDYVGFDLIVYSQAIDLSTPEGRLMYSIIASFAEYERDMIGQRIKFKLDHLRLRGVVPGKNSKIYDEGKARALWSGLSERDLAKALGVSKTTARRVKERMARDEGPRLRPLALTPEEMRIVALEAKIADLRGSDD